jgi:hypothetical protein
VRLRAICLLSEQGSSRNLHLHLKDISIEPKPSIENTFGLRLLNLEQTDTGVFDSPKFIIGLYVGGNTPNNRLTETISTNGISD